MEHKEIKDLVAKMTLGEKASLCSGEDFWHTKAIERLGIPAIMVSDGPHGLRKQEAKGDHLGMGDSIEAVCFPAGCLSASSFDRMLLRELGGVLGSECQAEKVNVLLGPAMNIKRSPLCGRNFEYYSEDPLVSTELAAAYIEGVQSKQVGTSPKHFAANSQEYRRMTSSSQIDERTLREIYLASFEGAIKTAAPWTIMGSYNAVNGTFATENEKLLTNVLREDWGFDGVAMTDWGAVNDRVAALKAGLELEMPGSNGVNDQKIVAAVQCGLLDESVLDRACERLLKLVFRCAEARKETAPFDREKDHAFSRKVAAESMVLLKNNGILPLSESSRIVLIGEYARIPRYQGGGSSHIHASKVVSAMDVLEGRTGVSFAQGFRDEEEIPNQELIQQAVDAARNAEVALLFVGLPERIESESFDRPHMRLPESQTALVEAVCAAQPNTVVLLHNGAPVEMPWVDKAAAVLECYLAGQAVGEAQCDILFGKVNPSGKLAETFPMRLEDNPTYPYYGMEKDQVEYREGVLVGYRYYDRKKMPVLFPFGHGLSYTSFEYSNLRLSRQSLKDTDTVEVSLHVTNTGKYFGREVVQLYVSPQDLSFVRPEKELRAFEKLSLMPGECKKVRFSLDKRAFAYWNTTIHDWHVVTGKYAILIGKSSRDIAMSAEVSVESTVSIPQRVTLNTTLGDILADAAKAQKVMGIFRSIGTGAPSNHAATTASDSAVNAGMMQAMMRDMPLRSVISFMGIPSEKLEGMLEELNQE